MCGDVGDDQELIGVGSGSGTVVAGSVSHRVLLSLVVMTITAEADSTVRGVWWI